MLARLPLEDVACVFVAQQLHDLLEAGPRSGVVVPAAEAAFKQRMRKGR